jgi:hypothetical protein
MHTDTASGLSACVPRAWPVRIDLKPVIAAPRELRTQSNCRGELRVSNVNTGLIHLSFMKPLTLAYREVDISSKLFVFHCTAQQWP